MTEGWVPSQPGQQRNENAIFFQTGGPLWRDRFETFARRDSWLSARSEFVIHACQALKLLVPTLAKPAVQPSSEAVAKDDKAWNMEEFLVPKPLARDQLWTSGSCLQLEFVVDNQTS